MISRRHRFHGYASLRGVYRNGETVRGPLFAIKYMSNPRRRSYRLAVVVSRRVHKSAVKRNRIRRRLYEATRLLEPLLTEPYDIVVTVFHDSVTDEPANRLSGQLKKQLKEAGIIKKR